jgi:hypothetical protein
VGVGVGGPNVLIDFLDQFFDAAKRPAANGLLRNPIEPDLHLILPRGIGGSEVHVESWPCCQPALDSRMFVRGVVVHDDMHIQGLGHVLLDLP